MNNLYNKELVDHYKNPRNFKKLEGSTHAGQGINAVCGDELYLQLKIVDRQVEEVGFQGSGCAICIGTMSILSEKIQGVSVEKLRDFNEEFVLNLVGMDEDSPRVRCATLSVEAIQDALK